MKFRNLKITAIVIAILLFAGTTTAFAANSLPVLATNNKSSTASTLTANTNITPIVSADSAIPADSDNVQIENIEGKSVALANGFKVIDIDGNEISFGHDNAELTAIFIMPNETNLNGNVPNIPPPTYTDEEEAQIIAEIESGERPPMGRFNDNGTFEFYNIPEDSMLSDLSPEELKNIEITVTLSHLDGTIIFDSAPVIFPGQ